MSYATTERTPKARKEHRCDWCPEPIDVGEVHCYHSGVDNEGFYSWRIHADCKQAIEREWDWVRSWEEISWGETHKRGMTLNETEGIE